MGEQDEAKLKKQFNEKDVARMRNIITKKFGDKTVTQVGYTKVEEEHKEGDIWEENGKEWTLKDGLKQTNTKLDAFKQLVMMPLFCPNCGHTMKSHLDKKMYPIHGKCFDCVIKMETELRRIGKYEEYARNIISGNISGFINDAKEFIIDFANETETSYFTEQGDKEEFAGMEDKKKMSTEWLRELDEMQNLINSKQDQKDVVSSNL